MSKLLDKKKYTEFLDEIKSEIKETRLSVYKKINRELLNLYWNIGRKIVIRQKENNWGRAIVETLSRDLQNSFPGLKGFSPQNLWYMRQFYETYKGNLILQPLVGEIGWSHNLFIMSKCEDDLEREYYIRMTKKQGWSKRFLEHQIENDLYRKTLIKNNNFELTLPTNAKHDAALAIKDEYIFDFLELSAEHSEKELEDALIAQIKTFLCEMGGEFAFVGQQFRLIVSDKEYFIDILLFHRGLNALVALELKIDDFKPEYAGKMQFYLAALDDIIRKEHENPSIGIVLCKTKDEVIVEYALRDSNRPMSVNTYSIVKTLPEEYRGKLPQPEEIKKLLEKIT